ncbi:general secretion pathway protein GspI [Methylocella silvestris]|uniref:General secretion pathway protein GspI n=1 Tax=Methylocella silvestris TaxID=199596 RepID=A0A2J7TCQ0_METSI|nr:general secretion pathway protein GspI [Methylocella silvestris]
MVRGSSRAGFTLIEALVALAVIAVCLAAIGSLVASNTRSVRQIEQRLALVSALRKIEAALPNRARLTEELSGEMGSADFSIGSTPFPDPSPPPSTKAAPAWTPQRIVITVRGETGSMIEVETLRLIPSETQ